MFTCLCDYFLLCILCCIIVFFHVSSVQDRGISYVIPSLMFYLGCGCVLFVIVFLQRFFFLQMYVMPACIILRGSVWFGFFFFLWLYRFFNVLLCSHHVCGNGDISFSKGGRM